MLMKGDVLEIPTGGTSSIPSPATYTVNFLPGFNGRATVDSSPFMPIRRGVSAGARFGETKKPSEVALSANTGINWLAERDATWVRNGGVVSTNPAYEPWAVAISSAPTGPSRLWPIT